MISERLIGRTISTSMLLSRAIAHDLDESMTGDFQRQFKYSSPSLRAEIGKASEQFMQALLMPFPPTVAHPIFVAWKSAKDDDLEGDIIKAADFLAVVAYIIKELRMGNQHLMDIVAECTVYGHEVANEVDHSPELVDIIMSAINMLGAYSRGN
jgi:5'-deoxynucleotidase YfbR-like HD superfamily hydrolase